MKHLYVLLFFFTTALLAQIPAGYYDSANGLTGYALKTELSNIITNGYVTRTYGELLTLYPTSDADVYYENDNTVLDMYSERPNGADAYNYTFSQNCGNFSREGDCYNREHIFPQGFFNELLPMRSDAHHVIPTDGWVNGGRSNFPFGIVGANATTYSNGSKVGASITPGFTGTVFEPIDEFKGDIARMLLYFATRYELNFNDSNWDAPTATNDPRDGSQNRWYEQWYINLLLEWHNQDIVSQKERDRNNAIYNFQGNRNPFVDNPQWVNAIWTSTGTPSGSVFATLSDTFIDVDNSGNASIGDRITYNYVISNIGSTTLFNITATPDFGTFSNPGQISTLAANASVNNPFGTLTYTLTAADLNTACNCFLNKLVVRAFFNAAGTNGNVTINSDDPDNFTNNDANGDNLPDDVTRTTFPGNATPGGTARELFISEYLEGSGNNKAIELANFTGNTIALSAYNIQRDTNGGGSWSGAVALSGSLPTGQVYVIARGNANAAILAQADLLVGTGVAMDYNGDDPIGLFKNNTLIDIVGNFGNPAVFGANVTLVRKATVTGPNTTFNLTTEWDSFGIDYTADLGSHTFGATAGIADTTLQQELVVYPNPSKGFFNIAGLNQTMDVIVYDITGRQVAFTRNDTVIANLSAGLYLVKVSRRQEVVVLKVIVE